MEITRDQNVASYCVVPLVDSANRPDYKANPTLAAGDVKVIRHTGGSWDVSNIGTLPSVIAGATTQILVTLTATELNPDDNQYPVIIQFIDAAGAEWDDQTVIIWTRPVASNVKEISDDSAAANNLESDYDGTGYNKSNSEIGIAGALGTQAKADVNTEVDTALTDIGLDHLISASVTGADVADNSIIAQIASKAATADWDTYDNTADSLEAISDGGVAADWTSGEREQIRDALGVDGNKTSATGGQLQTIDTVVDGIQTDLDNATDGLGAIKTAVDANQTDLTNIESKVDTVDTNVDAIKAVTDNNNGGIIDCNLMEINDLSVAGNLATLTLKQLDVQNSDGSAVVAKSIGGAGHGIDVEGNGAGMGIKTKGGATGHGIDAEAGDTSGNGIHTYSLQDTSVHFESGTGTCIGLEIDGNVASAIKLTGGLNAHGIETTGVGASGRGIMITAGMKVTGNGAAGSPAIEAIGEGSSAGIKTKGGTNGAGFEAEGGFLSGDGIKASAIAGNNNGMTLIKHGTGKDIDADEIDDILTDTNEIQGMLPSKSYLMGSADADGGFDTEAKADINAECDTALIDYDAPTKTEMDTMETNLTAEIDANEAKIDIVDTVVDGIQTDLDNATDGLGALKTLIDTVDTVVDGIQTDLDNGTDGLGAIKTAVDANQTDLTNIESKIDTVDTNVDSILADTGTDGVIVASHTTAAKAEIQTECDDALDAYDSANGVAKESSVVSIQNNTRFVAGLPNYFLVPTIGDNVYKVMANFYDNDGNMEDPDDNEFSIDLETATGTDKNGILYKEYACTNALDASVKFSGYKKLERSAVGRYFCYLKINTSETEAQFMYDFACEEASVALHYTRSNLVLEDTPGSTTLADNATNKEIIAEAMKERDVSATGAVSGSIHKDIMDNIDANETKIDTVDTVVDGIQTDLDNATDGLGAIKTAIDANQTDLTNIETKIDTVDTVVDGIQTDLDNATDGLGAIKTAVDDNQTDLASIEGKVDTVDTVVDGIQTDLDNATDGLGAIKTAVDANQTDLTSIESKVDTVDTVVDTIQVVTDNLPNNGSLTDIDTGINNIEAKLPSKNYLTGTANADGDIELNDATGAFPAGAFANHPDVDLNADQSGVTVGTVNALGTQAKADVNAEADTALSDIALDHLISTSVLGTDIADDSIIAQIVSKSATADWDTFDNTSDSLEAIADGGVAADWSSGEREQIRDALGIDGTKTTATGGQLQVVDTVVDGIQTDLDNGTDGLGAIKTVVDANQTDLTSIEGKIDTIDTNVDDIESAVGTPIALDSGLATLSGMLTKIADDNDGADFDATTDSLEKIGAAAGGTDWSANEKTEIKTVLGITNTGTPDPTPTGGVLKEIQDNVDTNEGKIDTIDTVVDGIQTDLDNATDGLGAIKTAVDANQTDLTNIENKIDTVDTVVDGIQTDLDNATDGLGAIKTAVDIVDTVADGIQTDLDNATDGLGAIKTAVDANQTDLASIEGKVDTIDTVVDGIQTNLTTVEDKVDTIDTVVDGIQTDLDNATDGLGAIKTAVDANQTDLTSIEGKIDTIDTNVDSVLDDTGTSGVIVNEHTTAAKAEIQTECDDALDAYDSANGVAKESSVEGIQNNTRFVAGLPNYFLVPTLGDNIYKVMANFYDSDGNMEDPDDNEFSIDLETATSTDKNGLLYKEYACTNALDASTKFSGYKKLERTSVGRYFCYLKINTSETEAQFMYDFACEESSTALHYTRSNLVLEDTPGSATLADNATNKEIIAEAMKERDVSATSAVSGSIHKDIMDNIDANETKIDTIDTVVDGIQTDLDNATDGLGAIKTAVDANQADITTINGKVDTIDTVVDGIQIDLDNATDGLGAIKTAVDANQTDLTTIEGKVDTAQADLDILTGTDGATLATSQPNYAPAKAGDNMNLADNAITSGKYDEITAYPIKSADAGITEIARTGADGDTLETLSDQIDTVDTVVDGIQTDLDNGIDGLGAIKTAVDANQADLTSIESKVDTVDAVVDGIQTDLDNATDGLGAIKTAVDANQTDLATIESKIDTIDTNVDDIETNVGTAISLDSGTASLAGMLTKMADDNAGADFDATTDSLHEIGAGGLTDWSSGEKEQIRDALGVNGTKTAAIGGQLQTIDTVVDGIQTDLDNGTDGLGAIKIAVDANQTDLTNIEDKIDTVDTVVDGIQTDLDNATDGLGALKALIDTVDTVVDGIQTDLDNTTDGLGAIKAVVDANQADLTDIETKIDTVDSIVDDILVDTGTTLNDKIDIIDTVVDTIQAKTDNLAFTSGNVHADIQEYNVHPDINLNADQSGVTIGIVNALGIQAKADVEAECDDALDAYDAGNGVAKESSVEGIQNNTRFVAGLPSYLLVPTSGDNVYKIMANFYDSDGNMEDPDDNEFSIDLEDAVGTDKNSILYKEYACTNALDASVKFSGYKALERSAIGRYFAYLKINTSETEAQLMYDFACEESSIALHYTRSNLILEESPGTTVLADNSINKDIIAEAMKERDVSGTSAVTGSVYDDIMDNIDANEVKLDTIDTVVDDIQADLDNGTDGLGAIKTAIDANQTDLIAIEGKIDTVDTVVDGIQTNLTTVEGKIDTVDTVVDGVKAKTDNLNFNSDGTPLVLADVRDVNDVAVSGIDDFKAGPTDVAGAEVNCTEIEGADATVQINAACDASIETYGLDHLLAVSATGVDVANNSVIAQMTSKSATADFDSFDNTTDSLEAVADAEAAIDAKLDIIDTVADGIQTDLDNATDGLGAIKTAIDANQTDLTTIDGKIDIIDSNVDAVLVDTGTTIPSVLGTPAGASISDDIAIIDTVVDGIQTDLDNGTDGLGAIKTAIDANQTDLTIIDGKIDIIDTNVDNIEANVGSPIALDSGTATIAGMLVKLADDNNGADYDAETDSLHEQGETEGDWSSGEKEQIRDALGVDGAKTTATDGQLQDVQTGIGTPIALDGGAATLSGMLTKMADDNDGADFDAETDSLHEMALIAGGLDWTVAEKKQIRSALGIDGTKVAAESGQLQSVQDDVNGIETEINSGTHGLSAIKTVVDDNQTDITSAITNIGTPVGFDGGGATIADNLKKIVDDNGGTTFDATLHSLQANREAQFNLSSNEEAQLKNALGMDDSGPDPVNGDLQNALAIVTLIKAVTDLIPDAGAMTSIAQEATLGTPVTSIAADIATVLTAINGVQTDLDNPTDGLGALLTAIQNIDVEFLNQIVDGSATVKIALKKCLAYCANNINRVGLVYTYRNYDDNADEMVLTGSTNTRVRS